MVQFATASDVFLFDFLDLQYYERFSTIMAQLLSSERILKIGMLAPRNVCVATDSTGLGVAQDLRDLRNSLLSPHHCTPCNAILDIVPMFSHIAPPVGTGYVPVYRLVLSISLQAIAMYVLQKKLDKKQCTSNWGHRPLSAAQIQYAAADATVAVDIFRTLKEEIIARDGSFNCIPFLSRLQAVQRPRPPMVDKAALATVAPVQAQLGGWSNSWNADAES